MPRLPHLGRIDRRLALEDPGGAHTVELNLEPSAGISMFAEAIHGKATEIVPAYVDRLLSG